jgi:hypothetical protein
MSLGGFSAGPSALGGLPRRHPEAAQCEEVVAVNSRPQTGVLLDQLFLLQDMLLEAEKRLDAIGNNLLGSLPEAKAKETEGPPPNGVMHAALLKVGDLFEIAHRIQQRAFRLEQV